MVAGKHAGPSKGYKHMATSTTKPTTPAPKATTTVAAPAAATTTAAAPKAPASAPLALTARVQLQPKYAQCPKRPGTASGTRAAAYWPVYAKGGTVAECLAAGATRADLAWDRKHGFIVVL